VIPRNFHAALLFFDALVAPSAFIRHTLDVELNSTTTIALRHPLYLPADVSVDRARFDIGADELVYVTSFEPLSGANRKNVHAVVEAFRRGLPDRAEARLLIRLNNVSFSSSLDSLHKACAGDRRIRLITEPLRYGEVLSLY